MIVRDARDPRGRYEDSGRRPLPLPDRLFVGAGGEPWREQFYGPRSHEVLFGRTRRTDSKWSLPLVSLHCEVCGKEFLTRMPKLARTCGATCRQRRRRNLRSAA
jgi:hypothetical protein